MKFPIDNISFASPTRRKFLQGSLMASSLSMMGMGCRKRVKI
ncbi:MAG: hypothetical protein WC959_01930 [Kiritimatiellales bacterium]